VSPHCAAPPPHTVREKLEVAGVEVVKTDSRLMLEFMGDARSTLLLPLAPSTSASFLAKLTFGTVA